ncbi:terminase large subunit [Sandaracinobacteroides hominis]|uniref:terminase large subunit n=1 Tax=Sandaracinobacteroides hominis TaxID=2780086 RepID=UPI0018F5044A|nr:terminase TerL endonuclease subunit [Sandaracinobacteroides hominis]
MAKRGPGSRKQIEAANREGLPSDRPWEAEGLTRAERVIAFIESLPVTKGFGAGEPMTLQPFQREWIEAVYATGDNGRRLVRTGLMSVGRGNGKTVLLAALCLAHLAGPEAEPRGECYSAAATKEQASLIFSEIEAWVYAVPWLARRLNVQTFHKRIADDETGSIYKALASDGPAAHGLAASFIVCDELAQWKRRELFDVLRTSMGKRKEPLLVAIGTQSADHDNMMSELVDYAERLQGGDITDPAFHGAVYRIPDEMDVFDPESWPLANPALGVFRSLEELQIEAERARRIPTTEGAFRNLYCNQRVDAEPKAIDPHEWDACGTETVAPLYLAGRPCYVGLDLSQARDLTAAVLYFPEDGGIIIPYFWCPDDAVREKEEQDRVPYRVWAKQSLIEIVPGNYIDREYVAKRLAAIAAEFDVKGLAYDRYGMRELQLILDRNGINLPLVPFSQNFGSMGPAVDAFEAAMLTGKLQHGGHPILRWMAGNAVFQMDANGNRKLAKDRSRDKIDGLVALVMAIGLAARTEVAPDVTWEIEWF